MLNSNVSYSTLDQFQGKSLAGQELYNLLLQKINQIGPVRETMKAFSITLENRKAFASVMIRNRSVKLVLRANHRIANSRILGMERVADKSFDHTILLESSADIDAQLLKWLGEAYQSSH